MPSEDNKRIARNTLFLYFRMGIIMLVKLYTSRVLLDVLGIEDYGVWNVVAAFVIAFQFVSSPLITATQRFLNFDMGKGGQRLNRIFNTSLLLFITTGVVILLALETIGLWFLNNKINFPASQISSVNWLFQFSSLTLLVNIIRMPYESALIAYERMSFYAAICIVEAFLLLGIAFILKFSFIENNLVLYGALNLISATTILIVFILYCTKHISCTKLKPVYDKSLVREIGTFSGWNLLGAGAAMTSNQGIPIVINIFFNVAYNATYGIAMQVNSAIYNIIVNFQKAANPQIVKSFSVGELDRTGYLVLNVSKFSFLIMFAVTFPLIMNLEYVLGLWLGSNIPPESVRVVTLTLIYLLFVSYSGPIEASIYASGNIRTYQIVYSCLILMNIILAYICFYIGLPVIWAIIVKIITENIVNLSRILYVRSRLGLSLCRSILGMYFSTALLIPVFMMLWHFIKSADILDNGITQVLITVPSFFIIYGLSVWCIYLTASQRNQIKSKISNIYIKNNP